MNATLIPDLNDKKRRLGIVNIYHCSLFQCLCISNVKHTYNEWTFSLTLSGKQPSNQQTRVFGPLNLNLHQNVFFCFFFYVNISNWTGISYQKTQVENTSHTSSQIKCLWQVDPKGRRDKLQSPQYKANITSTKLTNI